MQTTKTARKVQRQTLVARPATSELHANRIKRPCFNANGDDGNALKLHTFLIILWGCSISSENIHIPFTEQAFQVLQRNSQAHHGTYFCPTIPSLY